TPTTARSCRRSVSVNSPVPRGAGNALRPHNDRRTDEFPRRTAFQVVKDRNLQATEADMTQYLTGRTAIIYGGGGGIGGATARAVARDGGRGFPACPARGSLEPWGRGTT